MTTLVQMIKRLNNPSADDKKACVERMEAMGMFKAADNRRYTDYKREVKNNKVK